MTDLLAAIANNAAWCDAVVKTHGGETATTADHWHNARQSPPFYPNLITLSADGAEAQLAAIRTLSERDLEEGWGVKDSFVTLDLTALGFEILFEAQWLYRKADMASPASPTAWQRVANEPKLAAWERGFSQGEEPMHLFRPGLLADRDISFFSRGKRDDVKAGFAFNRHAGVCGITNVFAPGDAKTDFLDGVIRQAALFANGAPLVSYMPDNMIGEWQAVGFEAIGPLRVWVKT